MFLFKKSSSKVPAEAALPGRQKEIPTAKTHHVLNTPLKGPYPDGAEMAMFGLGCFWGAERKFWELGEGIITTAVGYSAGDTPNATYDEVCTGLTNHNEVVLVVFDPAKISYADLLKTFWESHNPTQGMRQANDSGTQYRSGIYTFSDEQQDAAVASKDAYEKELLKRGYSAITTEILPAAPFYFAEEYHQQYLAKVPDGYCGLGGTGVSCPIGTGVETSA
jgi:peptide-methionine (S)-S-oxide reductase